MGNAEITIVCYADDAVLIAENEDNLQGVILIQTNSQVPKYGNIIDQNKVLNNIKNLSKMQT